MGTSHVLMGMVKRTAVEDGAHIPTGGRERWKAELRLAAVTGAMEVVLEVSATAEAGTWVQVATFGSLSVAGTYVLDSTKDTSDFTTDVTERDVYLRARLATIGTDATFDVVVRAPWLDYLYEPHALLLSKEVRNFSDGVERLVAMAEHDVMMLVTAHPSATLPVYDTPEHVPGILDTNPLAAEQSADAPQGLVFDADVTLMGFGEAIRHEVAKQAHHLYVRHQLSLKRDKDSAKAYTSLGALAPGLGRALKGYRPRSRDVVRGR